MKKLPAILSILFIALMIILAIVSLKQESAIMDEVAHTPAGYSYLTQKDMRLNPEHPPLLKDLSAIPLLFVKGITFPNDIYSWTEKVNGQWDFGFNFLYESNNDADQIMFWSRLPMLLLLILLGFLIYRFTRKLYGKWPAFIATFLFAFSPTFIAHGRYVTTDVGAAFGFFIATFFFIKYLQKDNKKNLILAGIFFGVAQLIKFSLILLLPFFGLLLLIWIWVNKKRFWKYIWKFILIVIIGYLLVYPVYLFHIIDYPAERQISDTEHHASHFPLKPAGDLVKWMSKQPILRPYSQYTLGLFMVFQRATGGNTTYFLGDVTNKGWHSYFPIMYIIKTPLALQILTIIALLFLAWQCKKITKKKIFPRIKNWLKKYFVEFAMLLFLAIYWAASIKSNLNIGVRHILPTFPFVYILLSGQIKRIFDKLKKPIIFYIIIAVLLIWYAISSLAIFPYYLSYFSELVGGAKNGYIYATDSNLDWGQDVKRLVKWLDEQGIDKIYLDYFGGATPEYYLGDKLERWWDKRDPKEAKGKYVAISATFLQQNRANPTKGWSQRTDHYLWLNDYEPVIVIGNSIFVFYIPK